MRNTTTEDLRSSRWSPPDDSEIRELARRIMAERSPNGVARALGVGRQTALSLAAGAWCTPGTFALIRERVARSAELRGHLTALRSVLAPAGSPMTCDPDIAEAAERAHKREGSCVRSKIAERGRRVARDKGDSDRHVRGEQ